MKIDRKDAKIMSYKNSCSGCMACLHICPAGCIQVKTDAVGNFVRVIDVEKCIKCGCCESVCPTDRTGDDSKPKRAYLAWSKKVERKSSSGGIATAIYRYGISKQITCVGVRWSKNFTAKYDLVKKDKIELFAGSKYVHSRMSSNIYRQILKSLEAGGKVIFIGLPCHVAALRNVVGNKDENLICIDLVCHGVPVNRFWQQHLKRLCKHGKDTIKKIEFRDKKNPYGLTIIGDEGQIIKRLPQRLDEYMSGYCEGFTYSEQCYNCSYASEERCADLTIKDFSGKWPERICLPPSGGISNILVNTNKGAALIEELKPWLELFEYPVESVIAEDAMLRRPTPRGKRDLFIKLYPVFGFDYSVRILCFPLRVREKVKQLLGNYEN